MNIDKILVEIEKFGFQKIPKAVSHKDIKILKSLYSLVDSNKFITENQGRLLVKILKENQNHLKSIITNLEVYLQSPTWSSPFRVIDQTKKISVTKLFGDDPMISIEFAYNANIRKILLNLTKIGLENVQSINGRIYLVELTEKNLVILLDALLPHNFEIDEVLLNYYNTIKSWNFSEILPKFYLENLDGSSLLKNLEKEIKDISSFSKEMIIDRKNRYHYFTTPVNETEKSIKNEILSRKGTSVWINSKEYTLEDVFKELKNLNRFPTLIIFDSYHPDSALDSIKKLECALDSLGITKNVGIYFRFDKNIGLEFNEIIAKRSYNAELNQNTVVAGIASNKLPKFFIKSNWKPLSVVAINSNLRYNKSAIYANCCDLVINYNDKPALIDTKNLWIQQS